MNVIRVLEDLNLISGGDTYATPRSPAPSPATDANLLAGRTLVEATVRRSLKREADRATKAASTLYSLDAWARAVYDEGERMNLTTELVRVIAPFAPPGRDVGALARALATEMHTESRRELADLTIAAPPELRIAVTKLTDHWLTNRPAIAADALLAKLTA